MKRLIIFLLLFAAIKVAGQTTGYLRFDTVKIMKQNGTCELYIINKTKDSLGLLTNVGGGLTRFIKSRASGDTLFVGLDTLIVEASAGNTNIGTTYRWLNEGTQQIKTAADSWGIKWDSTSTANSLTAKPDTTTGTGLPTYHYVDSSVAAGGAIPTWQQVTDAGQVTNDSVKVRTVNVDSALYLAVRRGADSIGMAQRRGLIMYDSVTGSLLYRGESFWTYLATLSNSLIPNRPNMRLIAGVLRPTVSAPNVVWNWIIDAEHDSIGFGAITCDGANVVLNLTTPATKIHTIIPVPDETLAGYIDVGASFQTDKAMLRIRRRIGVANGYIQGNGTTYTPTGSVTPTYTTATGNLLLDWVSAYATPANGVSVIYTGRNGYHVEKEFSAFGGADRRYTVVDAFGNPVTIAPTSDDVIEIVTPDWTFADINPCSSNGSDWAAAILGSSFGNIWVIGLIEY